MAVWPPSSRAESASFPRRSLSRGRGRLGAALIALVLLVGLVAPQASADDQHPDIANNGSTASPTVDPAAPTSANLTVSQMDHPDPVALGDHVFYTVTVRNHGPAGATGVVVTDALPTGGSFQSATPSKGRCTGPTGGVLTCRFGQLLKGKSARVTIDVLPSGPGTITNEATVSGDQPDPKPASNHATQDTLVVVSTADLSLSISDAPDPVSVGQSLTYSLDVHNGGPDKATFVKLTDQLPGASTFVSATASQGTCNRPNGSGVLNCRLGQIASGSGAQVTIVVSPTTSGSISDQASVHAAETDPTPADNDASEATTVTGVACTITGTPGDDTLSGTNGDDVICGLGGDDTIAGLNGNDRLDGGPGDDALSGNDGFDQLFGRSGNDSLGGGTGFDLVRFDGASSPVTADLAAGTASGEGTDTLAGIEGIVGSPDADTLSGDQNGNEIYGRGGNDQIFGGNGFDYARYDFSPAAVQVDLSAGTASGEGTDALAGIEGIVGSNANDTLTGDDKDNRFVGRSGDDAIKGGNGFDYASYDLAPSAVQVDLGAANASGGDGTDSLVGIEGILGSAFADTLAGDASANQISGRAGADDILGGDGRDNLFGEDGNDSIQGQRGDDFLDGGPGSDRLDGGADHDRCISTGVDKTISCEAVGSPAARARAAPPIS